MKVYEYTDYKEFVIEQIENMPQKGHGQYRKMAAHLNVSSVQISHIFKGDRHLTDEQALEVAGFFSLNTSETEYFITMAHKDRAGTVRLKNHYILKLKGMKEEALAIKNRLKKDLELKESAQAIYYSQWYYGAVRICCFHPKRNTPSKISEYLALPLHTVLEVLEFLEIAGLVSKDGNNAYSPTSKIIYLDKKSPFIFRNHSNWRLKAIENMTDVSDDQEMFFTYPMIISKEAAAEIRRGFAEIISKVTEKARAAESENIHCLNIDWFRLKR